MNLYDYLIPAEESSSDYSVQLEKMHKQYEKDYAKRNRKGYDFVNSMSADDIVKKFVQKICNSRYIDKSPEGRKYVEELARDYKKPIKHVTCGGLKLPYIETESGKIQTVIIPVSKDGSKGDSAIHARMREIYEVITSNNPKIFEKFL